MQQTASVWNTVSRGDTNPDSLLHDFGVWFDRRAVGQRPSSSKRGRSWNYSGDWNFRLSLSQSVSTFILSDSPDKLVVVSPSQAHARTVKAMHLSESQLLCSCPSTHWCVQVNWLAEFQWVSVEFVRKPANALNLRMWVHCHEAKCEILPNLRGLRKNMNPLSNHALRWIRKHVSAVISQKNPKFLTHCKQHPNTEQDTVRYEALLEIIWTFPKANSGGKFSNRSIDFASIDMSLEKQTTSLVFLVAKPFLHVISALQNLVLPTHTLCPVPTIWAPGRWGSAGAWVSFPEGSTRLCWPRGLWTAFVQCSQRPGCSTCRGLWDAPAFTRARRHEMRTRVAARTRGVARWAAAPESGQPPTDIELNRNLCSGVCGSGGCVSVVCGLGVWVLEVCGLGVFLECVVQAQQRLVIPLTYPKAQNTDLRDYKFSLSYKTWWTNFRLVEFCLDSCNWRFCYFVSLFCQTRFFRFKSKISIFFGCCLKNFSFHYNAFRWKKVLTIIKKSNSDPITCFWFVDLHTMSCFVLVCGRVCVCVCLCVRGRTGRNRPKWLTWQNWLNWLEKTRLLISKFFVNGHGRRQRPSLSICPSGTLSENKNTRCEESCSFFATAAAVAAPVKLSENSCNATAFVFSVSINFQIWAIPKNTEHRPVWQHLSGVVTPLNHYKKLQWKKYHHSYKWRVEKKNTTHKGEG